MEGPSSMLLISILSLLLHLSLSSTVVIDGVTKLRDPTAHIGDSIIFKHKYEYKLYIFQNRGDFKLCNFTRATLVTKPNSTSFTVSPSLSISLIHLWHPSRLGFFYFSFNNGSSKPCQEGQKIAIKVSTSPPLLPEHSASAPELSPSAHPAPFSGGSVMSSPAYPWPFQPRESQSPSPTQTEFLPLGPASAPERGVPFINSNPVVPFPAGEVDSATIRPVPTSQGQVVVGLLAAQRALFFVTFVLLH